MPSKFRSLSVAFVSSIFCLSTVVLADVDIDGDGNTDLIVVNIDDNGNLDWNSRDSDSFSSETLIPNGRNKGEEGDQLIPANWTSSDTTQIGYLSRSRRNVSWFVVNGSQTEELAFGRKNNVFIAGGDYDGNGIADALIVKGSGMGTIRFNPFAGGTSEASVDFPRKASKKGTGFFFSPDGQIDRAAFVYRQKLRRRNNTSRLRLFYADLNNNSVSQRLSGVARGAFVAAMPIQRENGIDAILLVQKVRGQRNVYQVRIFEHENGTVLFSNNYSSNTGTVVVGNFDPNSAGEEFIVQRSAPIVVRPFGDGSETELDSFDGVLVDDVNTATFRQSSGGGGTGGDACSGGFAPFGAGRLWKPAADAADSREGKPVVLLQGGSKNGERGTIAVYATNGVQIGALSFKGSSIPGINGNSDHYFSGWPGGSGDTCGEFAAKARQANGDSNVVVQWKGNQCLGPVNPCSRAGNIF